jgi:hypothetical protein
VFVLECLNAILDIGSLVYLMWIMDDCLLGGQQGLPVSTSCLKAGIIYNGYQDADRCVPRPEHNEVSTMSQISAADSDRFLPDRPVVFRNATVLTID